MSNKLETKTICHQDVTGDEGMATAEYAMVTLAAVAFAGLLLAVLTSDGVRQALVGLIQGALNA